MFSIKSLTNSVKALLVGLFLVVGTFFVAAQPASATTYEVKMGTDNSQLKFEPAELTIQVGDTIEWVNNKVFPHNVVFDKVPGGDKALAKELSYKRLMTRPGQTFEDTFTQAGEYSYFCTPHRGAGMVGKITVEG